MSCHCFSLLLTCSAYIGREPQAANHWAGLAITISASYRANKPKPEPLRPPTTHIGCESLGIGPAITIPVSYRENKPTTEPLRGPPWSPTPEALRCPATHEPRTTMPCHCSLLLGSYIQCIHPPAANRACYVPISYHCHDIIDVQQLTARQLPLEIKTSTPVCQLIRPLQLEPRLANPPSAISRSISNDQ